MIKLKSILSEGYAWEREAGKPLPTLADTTAAHAAKLAEQSAEQAISNPMETPLKESDDIYDEIADELGLTPQQFDDALNKTGAELDVIDRLYHSNSLTRTEALSQIADLLDVQIGHDASQQDNVFDIIMTYTKDPDEAEAAYDAWLNGDSMPAAIEANVTRDPRWAAIRQPQREAAKPDFLDLDGDGDEEESMKSAAADRKEDMHEAFARRLMGNLKGSEHILRETFRK
jgi:hypothetical protein